MYELWGGGPPFTGDGSGNIFDVRGRQIKILGVVREVLHDLKSKPEYSDVKVAWVSCTDEPDWADTLLKTFITSGGDPLESVVHSSQIFKSNKKVHFQRLKQQYPDIAFEDMLFFDNEYGNIRSVSSLGVKCIFCPDGVTADAWADGLKLFS